MEIIQLPGYTQLEKLRIAQQFLVPKQLENHGLTPKQVVFEETALVRMIQAFTKEAGVRNMEREIAGIARKVARKVASNARTKVKVKADDLEEYIGPAGWSFPTPVGTSCRSRPPRWTARTTSS
jgi:ATP-dependent Lon protease